MHRKIKEERRCLVNYFMNKCKFHVSVPSVTNHFLSLYLQAFWIYNTLGLLGLFLSFYQTWDLSLYLSTLQWTPKVHNGGWSDGLVIHASACGEGCALGWLIVCINTRTWEHNLALINLLTFIFITSSI